MQTLRPGDQESPLGQLIFECDANAPPDTDKGWFRGPFRHGRPKLRARNEPSLTAFNQFTARREAGNVASRAYEYRERAQQCLEMARTFGDRNARATLSHMAQAWLRLAILSRNDAYSSNNSNSKLTPKGTRGSDL